MCKLLEVRKHVTCSGSFLEWLQHRNGDWRGPQPPPLSSGNTHCKVLLTCLLKSPPSPEDLPHALQLRGPTIRSYHLGLSPMCLSCCPRPQGHPQDPDSSSKHRLLFSPEALLCSVWLVVFLSRTETRFLVHLLSPSLCVHSLLLGSRWKTGEV